MTLDMSLTHLSFAVDGDGVATVLIDRAGEAMNTLSPDLGDDLDAVVTRVETDPGIVALVIGSAKKDNFLAGADIRFLQSLSTAEEAAAVSRDGQEGFARVERLHTEHGKPVVAAIHGACLGGGLELALACSYRVCTRDDKTVLGQPEVQIGLIPGAGGTQRLPRLIGLAAGLDLVLTGRNVRPRRARKLGLVDEVVPKEVLFDVARQRALTYVRAGKRSVNVRSTIMRFAMEGNPAGRRLVYTKAAAGVHEKTKGNYPAPLAALDVVRIGFEEGAEAGYAAEAERFGRLVTSPEAAALTSIFFAGQQLKRESGVADRDVEPRPVGKVAVLGGGLMGGGIAAVTAASAGIPVRIKEVNPEGVRRGLAHVRAYLNESVKRRKLRAPEADRVMQTVTGTEDLSGFGNVDVVIEAVFEDLDLKRALLQEVEGVTRPDTIFASNTSSLPIADIATASRHPETVIGMHYFSPVEKMPLLEVIVTEQTADWVTATCVELGKKQGKTVIVVGDGTGFYTTRILGPYMNEVGHLLAEGASVEAIDDAMVAWGFPVGPVVLIDEVGIDVGAKIATIMEKAYGDRLQAPGNFARLLEDDRMGRKNGRGFYRYEDGKKQGVDDTVYAVIGQERRSEIPAEVIQERLALPMVNEAARCFEEGILRSARDGDVGAVFGLGFPPFRGGPFAYVDSVGARHVVDRLDALAAEHGGRFAAADVLREHATSGQRFRS